MNIKTRYLVSFFVAAVAVLVGLRSVYAACLCRSTSLSTCSSAGQSCYICSSGSGCSGATPWYCCEGTCISCYLGLCCDTSSGCFLPGTEITMANGSKEEIQNLKEGDQVLSYNLETEEEETATVSALHETTSQDYYKVKLRDLKTGEVTELQVTGEHPLLVRRGGLDLLTRLRLLWWNLLDWLKGTF